MKIENKPFSKPYPLILKVKNETAIYIYSIYIYVFLSHNKGWLHILNSSGKLLFKFSVSKA